MITGAIYSVDVNSSSFKDIFAGHPILGRYLSMQHSPDRMLLDWLGNNALPEMLVLAKELTGTRTWTDVGGTFTESTFDYIVAWDISGEPDWRAQPTRIAADSLHAIEGLLYFIGWEDDGGH
jgi:hypothetical protein